MRILFAVSLIALGAATAAARPVRSDHPVIGTWKVALTDSCTEVHSYRLDGTMHVVSGEEISDLSYEISETPNLNGRYWFSNTVFKTNGKPDCLQTTTRVGEGARYEISFDPSGHQMTVFITTPNNNSVVVTMVRE